MGNWQYFFFLITVSLLLGRLLIVLFILINPLQSMFCCMVWFREEFLSVAKFVLKLWICYFWKLPESSQDRLFYQPKEIAWSTCKRNNKVGIFEKVVGRSTAACRSIENIVYVIQIWIILFYEVYFLMGQIGRYF